MLAAALALALLALRANALTTPDEGAVENQPAGLE
jgi:hypothetical protein